MYESDNEKQSHKLEDEADTLIVDILRLLAEATDLRCLVHGKLRYLDKKLLKKCVHLIMIYDDLSTLNQLSKNINLGMSTLSKMINDSEEQTANRTSVDKIINYMYKIADKYERQLKKPL